MKIFKLNILYVTFYSIDSARIKYSLYHSFVNNENEPRYIRFQRQ